MPEFPAKAEEGLFRRVRGLFRAPAREGEGEAADEASVLAHDDPAPVAPQDAPPTEEAPVPAEETSVPAGDDPSPTPNSLPKYGPFHRRASPTQKIESTKKAMANGELWGKEPFNSLDPVVQAYNGPLPEGKEGFEFYTDVEPNPYNAPSWADWSLSRSGVESRVREADGQHFAVIPIVITRVDHKDIQWSRE